MAENNLARNRHDLPDFFADDDPLAELARIVGYDDLPVAAKPAPAAPAPRHEPNFNLEDELLQEFERYDAPRLDPIHDIALDDAPLGVSEPEPAAPVAVELQSLWFAPAERLAQEQASAFQLPDTEARDRNVFDFGDEEPAFAAEPVFAEPAAPEVFVEQSAPEPVVEQPGDHFEPIFDLPEAAEPVAAYTAAPAATEEFDLAAELESSFGVQPVATGEVRAEPQSKPEAKSKGYIPGFRMPLANFNKAHEEAPATRQEPIAPKTPEPVEQMFDAPALDDFGLNTFEEAIAPKPQQAPVDELPVAVSSHAFEPFTPAPTPVAPPAEPAAAPAAAVPNRDQFSALDELIYDVQRYSMPQGGVRSLATPVAKAPEPAPVVEPVAVTAPVVAATVIAEPVAPVAMAQAIEIPAVEERDPFSDDEFELALDDLDLELDDIVIEEPAVVAAPVAPIVAAPVWAETHIERSTTVAAPMMVEPELVVDIENPADLPFDPAMIAESEDQVEAIADLDVPALPVEEPEEPPVYRHDYELDIDAELATLLMSPGRSEMPATRKPDVSFAPAMHADRPQQPNRQGGYSDLDDFERALEEDFRRSLNAPLPASEQEELQYNDSDYVATVETARRSVRSWAVPLALVAVVVLGGAGAYAWFGKGMSSMVSGGEPVIIAADKEPIKIAPENPGGKTVPNQDKAVYDRVAGVSPQDPKQRTLISSNEQPIDVIQKTLMPDTLTLNGEEDVQPTDVGDTQDARLLPQQPKAAPTSAEQQPVTVMPRKVKTMIVRADGKLVEQEVVVPASATPQSEKMPPAVAKAVDVAAVLPQSQPAPTSSRTQPAPAGNAAVVPVSAPVNSATPANAAKPAPVTAPPAAVPAQAAAPASKAPVPTTRPAEQPVNVVAAVSDQGTVRAASQPAATAPAQNQVAALGDGGYLIQIASLPSQAEAQKSYQTLSSKFGSVIGGKGVDIKQAEISGKGTFYRVRIPAGSKNDALALCERYKSAGGTCLVAK